MSTIYDQKKSFLSSQLRLLSTPLEPPRNWQHKLPESEHGDLSESVLEQVLYKLNVVARKHHKLAYSAQLLRQVAEQIDALYWERSDREEGEDVLRRGTDLKDPANIEQLPDTWSEEAGESEEDLEKYQLLKARLTNQSLALKEQRQRHAYYAHLKQLLEPFVDPVNSVQPNLVTRDSPLDQELVRMRSLAARLAIQIARLPPPTEEKARMPEGTEMEGSVEDRLMKILQG
ncbi:hypothetical protein RUND412_010036 [Rhizina undulata]